MCVLVETAANVLRAQNRLREDFNQQMAGSRLQDCWMLLIWLVCGSSCLLLIIRTGCEFVRQSDARCMMSTLLKII